MNLIPSKGKTFLELLPPGSRFIIRGVPGKFRDIIGTLIRVNGCNAKVKIEGAQESKVVEFTDKWGDEHSFVASTSQYKFWAPGTEVEVLELGQFQENI